MCRVDRPRNRLLADRVIGKNRRNYTKADAIENGKENEEEETK